MRRRGRLVVLVLIGLVASVSAWDKFVREPELRAQFRAALVAGIAEPHFYGSTPEDFPGAHVIAVPQEAIASFEDRLRRVPGWDRLAAPYPYSSAAPIANEAAGINPWLQLRLRMTDGGMQDRLRKVLVIDSGRVVTTLYFGAWPAAPVVRREP